MLKKRSFKLTGISPFIPHNGHLAHPLNPYSKAIRVISAKRKKVDADYEEMSHLEFLGSLYWISGEEPCISQEVIRGVLIGKGGASRNQRMGKKAELAILVSQDAKLFYDGPPDPEELWKNGGFRFDSIEKIQSVKIARTRPIFREWSATVEIEYNTDFINDATLDDLLAIAGAECGIGDRRPTYGRFSVEAL